MMIFLSGGILLVSLIALLLLVLRLRSGRARLIAVASYAIVLVAVVALVSWREYRSPEREYGRLIDEAVSDLGEKYVLFRSLGSPGSTAFEGEDCNRGAVREDHRYLQHTWRLLQPVDFPTLEASLERDGFETSPISNSGAVAYGFLANRDNLAIQVQSLEMGTEVRFYYGPCVPRPTIEMASVGRGPVGGPTILAGTPPARAHDRNHRWLRAVSPVSAFRLGYRDRAFLPPHPAQAMIIGESPHGCHDGRLPFQPGRARTPIQ